MTFACVSHLLTDAEMLAQVTSGVFSDPISDSKFAPETRPLSDAAVRMGGDSARQIQSATVIDFCCRFEVFL